MKRKRRLRLAVATVSLILLISKTPLSAKNQECLAYDAIYKPHNNANHNNLFFSLKIENNRHESLLERNAFFIFEAFLSADYEAKVSDIRFGYNCHATMISRCYLSNEYGQYEDLKNLSEFQNSKNFDLILLDEHFYPLNDYVKANTKASEYIIIPSSRDDFQELKQYPNDTKKYVRYFSENKVFPNFGGQEIWRLERCEN